jgi:hypothetical protein
MVSGKLIPDENWDLAGKHLEVHHKELGIGSLGADITIEGIWNDWNTGNNSFQQKTFRHVAKMIDGTQRYVLPGGIEDAGPVIVTDDTIDRINDKDLLSQQFRVTGTTVLDIEFKHPNKLLNPTFHYDLEDWESTGATPITSTGSLNPLVGDGMAVLGELAQQTRVDEGQEYTLSAYAATMTGSYNLDFTPTYYDALNRALDTGSATSQLVDTDWTRYSFSISEVPTGATSVHLSLATTGELILDCVQFEEGDLSPFSHLPRGDDMTVEYETGAGGWYQVGDLNLAPVRNSMHSGFIHIPAVSAHQWDTGALLDTTTLNDWRWAWGRTDLLPWAKTHGINKWRRVTAFDEESPLVPTDELAYGLPVASPSTVVPEPGLPLARQSTDGIEFALEVRDTNRNPYSFEDMYLQTYEEQGAFPGYLAFRQMGRYTQLGQTISPETDPKGQVTARFIPPLDSDIEFRGDKPEIVDPPTGRASGYISTRYTVNPTNHGNVSVLDQFETLITGQLGVTETRLLPRHEGAYSVYDLPGEYPVIGTITVQEEDSTGGLGYPLEESRNPLLEDSQFFVGYEEGRLSLKGSRKPVHTAYRRRLTWLEPTQPTRVHIDQEILDAFTGDMVVRYDAKIKIAAQAAAPTGLSEGSVAWKVFDAVAQNPHRGEVR